MFDNWLYKTENLTIGSARPVPVYIACHIYQPHIFPPIIWQQWKHLESHTKLRDLYTEAKGSQHKSAKLVFKVTIRISHDNFLSLSINNSNNTVIICHLRPRDVIKFKTRSSDTGYRNKDASQDIRYILLSLLSPFPENTCWQILVLWTEPKIQIAECSNDWQLIGSILLFPELRFCFASGTMIGS